LRNLSDIIAIVPPAPIRLRLPGAPDEFLSDHDAHETWALESHLSLSVAGKCWIFRANLR